MRRSSLLFVPALTLALVAPAPAAVAAVAGPGCRVRGATGGSSRRLEAPPGAVQQDRDPQGPRASG